MPGFVVPGAGGGHNTAQTSRREYYYNYFWEIVNLFEAQQGWSDPNSPLIGLKDATLPTMTVNKESYNAASLEYKFAKSVTWEDIKVSWYDSVGLLKIMKQWRESVWTPECGLSDASTYKRQSRLSYYLPTGFHTNTWLLKNSWPSQIRHGDLTYTSSDVKLIEVTITYDWAVEQPSQ